MGLDGTNYNKYSLAKRHYNSYVPVIQGTDTFFAQRSYLEGSISIGTVEVGAVEIKDDLTTSRARVLAPSSVSSATKGLVVVMAGGTVSTSVTNELPIYPSGTTTYDSVNIGTDATSIIGSNASRYGLIVTNLTGGDLFLGTSNAVGSTTGFPVKNNESFTPESTNAVYGVIATGTGDAYYWQEVK